ncbi:hypothetical protein COO60DRAFT_183681 [Scenedesmus sp. NREL 46B-D3]|nr:hypothetical protein COO60DRAFT_183681 [Scenedesmus sp. NREL 46B-D3]
MKQPGLEGQPRCCRTHPQLRLLSSSTTSTTPSVPLWRQSWRLRKSRSRHRDLTTATKEDHHISRVPPSMRMTTTTPFAFCLKEYLRRTQVSGLLEATEGPDDTIPIAVTEFAELVDGGVYTHAPCSKEAFARLQEQARYLQQALEDEFGYAVLHHAQQTEPDQGYVLHEDLRKLPNANNTTPEDDVVIVGKPAAWVGSHAKNVTSHTLRMSRLSSRLLSVPRSSASCQTSCLLAESQLSWWSVQTPLQSTSWTQSAKTCRSCASSAPKGPSRQSTPWLRWAGSSCSGSKWKLPWLVAALMRQDRAALIWCCGF